jgi:hypothetical protein
MSSGTDKRGSLSIAMIRTGRAAQPEQSSSAQASPGPR